MESVRLLDGETVIEVLSIERARELKRANQAHFVNHGKDMRLTKPIEDTRCELEKVTGWNISQELQACALNRGRSGQFTIGYPIPYAFEGHLTSPRASVVNAGDRTNLAAVRV